VYLEATFKEYKIHHNQGEASYVFKEEPYDLKCSSATKHKVSSYFTSRERTSRDSFFTIRPSVQSITRIPGPLDVVH
jgi:hypothetical protein